MIKREILVYRLFSREVVAKGEKMQIYIELFASIIKSPYLCNAFLENGM